VGRDGDARLPASVQDAALDVAAEQGVHDLQIRDGMNRVSPPDRLRTNLRQSDRPHVPGLHHLGDGSDRVLDRHRRIEAARAIDVHVVGA
jgi:hypothetical protein